jgi:hypothetical protein
MLEACHMTEVPERTKNELRSISSWLVEKYHLGRGHVCGEKLAGNHKLESNVAEDICNGVVAMGETLLSCCLYGEIMARRHRPALMMM